MLSVIQQRICVKSYAVILYRYAVMGICLIRSYADRATLGQLHQTVLDRIFHDGLDSKRRDLEILAIHFKSEGHIRKTDIFNADIVMYMVHFLRHRDRLGVIQLAEVTPQIFGKVMHQFPCFFRIQLAKLLNTSQGIINKVGTDLAHHGGDAALGQLGIQGVTLRFRKNEFVSILGQSGCGKTTVGRTILQLYKPTDGEVWFDGTKIEGKKTIHEFRRNAQMVFQDPYSSLDPRMTVSDIIGEPLDVHHLYSNRKEREEKIGHLMDLVGLTSDHASRYAHEFSGGQRQRIGIARALYKRANILFFDEATSSLDNATEQSINRAIESLSASNKELTIVVVAHRDSSLDYCDRIVTLEKTNL